MADLCPGDVLELVVRIKESRFNIRTCATTRRTIEITTSATVHYVRRRGDYQVDVDGMGRLWVSPSGHLRRELYARPVREEGFVIDRHVAQAFVRRPRAGVA